MLPLTLTREERRAALNPGLPAEVLNMEVKPGFKTSEFWVAILGKLGMVVLAYLAVSGGPLEAISKSVSDGGGIAGIVAPLAKEALLGLIALLLQKLTTKYGEQRAELKKAAASA